MKTLCIYIKFIVEKNKNYVANAYDYTQKFNK